MDSGPRRAARLRLALLLGAIFLAVAARSIHLHRNDAPVEAAAAPDPYALSSLSPVERQRVARVRFTDTAATAGLDYAWKIPGGRPLDILQTIGDGCAFLDYDGDGCLDILLVGPRLALYRGDGHGRFTDVTHRTGLDRFHGHFLGCAVGDYDNDGFPDIYISGRHTGLLLHNEHGKRFRDVTQEMGLRPQPWGTSCAWADLDGDGYLDLYVCNYVDFQPRAGSRLCSVIGTGGTRVSLACEPTAYRPLKGVLYHNLHGRKFEDVTHAWGFDRAAGAGLGVSASYAGTGGPALAVANDERPGDLFRHPSAGRWQNDGTASGTAFDAEGHVHGGMGVDWGDFDNDGKLDLAVATFEGQAKNLYHNRGDGLFEDVSAELGVMHYTRHDVAFGCKFMDVDNKGWLDLLFANGHTYDNVADVLPGRHYRQQTRLLYNLQGRRFFDASIPAGLDRLPPIVGRGLATGDFDNDGRIDALVVDSEGRPQLLHNATAGAGHWLLLKLRGTRSNRDGYGAIVTIHSGSLTQTRLCHADGSYLSSSDPRVHVGLGDAVHADVAVQWPSGIRDTYPALTADRILTLREGETLRRTELP